MIQRPAERLQLHQVQASLPSFALADVGLGLIQEGRQLLLGDTSADANVTQHGSENFVLGRED
ncbi:hypothetical protein AYO47_02870 [Planctomyces sp. SCGC AG-212-M04]|nr:hypothetical protein AYO47_02870 [Planctomyces sp. SCGC AG-212-M04]